MFVLCIKFTLILVRQESFEMVIYIFSQSSCLYLPSGSQSGIVLLFFIFLSREICGRAEMEMVLDVLCLEIWFFQKPGSIKAIMLGFPDREGTGRVL